MLRSGEVGPFRRARRLLSGASRVGALTTAAGVLLAVCVTSTTPAGAAGNSSSLAAQATDLEARLVATAHQLHLLAAATAQDQARLTTANAALAADRSVLAQAQGNLAQATGGLRTVALNSYMSDSDSAESLALFSSTPTEQMESQAYEAVAGSTESEAIDQFIHDQAAVSQQISLVTSEQNSAASADTDASQAYSALQAAGQQEQAMLDSVRHQQAQLQGPPVAVRLTGLSGPGGSLAEDLARLRQCESGDNYQADTGNGYYGAYQFSLGTWQGLGYSGTPNTSPPPTQDAAATRLEQSSGWSQWPVCAAMLGLD